MHLCVCLCVFSCVCVCARGLFLEQTKLMQADNLNIKENFELSNISTNWSATSSDFLLHVPP